MAALATIACLLAVPYATAGPGFFADDWFNLRGALLDGVWLAPTEAQLRARPGVGVVYATSFGLIGAQPLVHFAIAVVVMFAAAVLLHRVAVRFLPARAAFAVALVWLLQPNHTSLEMWPSALNIAIALLLALIACDRWLADESAPRNDLIGVGAGMASMFCYEATAPVLLAAVLWIAWRRPPGSARRRLLVWGPAGLFAAGLWQFVNWPEAKSRLDEWISWNDVVPAHIGYGVFGANAAGRLLGLVALGGSVGVLVEWWQRRADRSTLDWTTRAVGVGWVIVVLGTIPFVRYFYSPVGLGDRVTVVSGVGGALVLVGTAGWFHRKVRIVGWAFALAALALSFTYRLSLVDLYATAADDGRRVIEHVDQRWSSPPDHPIVFGPYPVVRKNVVAHVDASWALGWLYGTRDVETRTTFTEEQFEDYPETWRVNLVGLAGFEPDRKLLPDD